MSAHGLDAGAIERALGLLHEPGGVFEVRALDAGRVLLDGRRDPRRQTICGFFNSAGVAARAIEAAFADAEFPALYVTLNPVVDALLARSCNRFRVARKRDCATSDANVARRRWLLIDLDPVRPSGISASDAEKEEARAAALRIQEFLTSRGWPGPVFADSGNGFHLLYRIDLPGDDGNLVSGVLRTLAARFDSASVKVDTSVFNPSRIVKLYGTAVRKGDDTPQRPHRPSGLIEVPPMLEVTGNERLQSLAGETSAHSGAAPASAAVEGAFNLEKFVESNFPDAETEAWSGGTRWIIDPCPFNSEHVGTSAAILRTADGVIAFKCQHAGCADRKWSDLREKFQKPKKATSTQRRESDASLLVDLAENSPKFHTPDGVPFIDVTVDGHRETWPVKSAGFQRWLRREFWRTQRSAPASQAVADAIGTIEGQALFEGPKIPVHLRVAAHEGAVYVDLCDEEWCAARVDGKGWKVESSDVPVRFRRAHGMLALPVPLRGGSLDRLRELMAVEGENWSLMLAWLIGTFNPAGPYAVLVLVGPQGSTKSTRSRMLRGLIDPNAAPLRSLVREERDLVIAANNSHVLCFDNVSHLPQWLSDGLCRMSTGGGFGTRELYTDSSEVLFSSQRPIVLNGIEEFVTRGDLLDRSLIVELEPLPDGARKEEREVFQAYEGIRPQMLGALLDGVSAAIRNRDAARVAQLPRLADFASWVTAAEPGLGAPAGSFVAAYGANRADANGLAIEASSVGTAIRRFMSERSLWRGTATDLLKLLDNEIGEESRTRGWPAMPKSLSDALRRVLPNLAGVGISVVFEKRKNNQRRILITRERIAKSASPPSREEQVASIQDLPRDDERIDEESDWREDAPASRATPWNERGGDEGDDGDAGSGALLGDECPSMGDRG